ncbi:MULTISPECIES: NAD-dependent succinate-semialdehyde dehydrogenase [unclassified Haloarcula]|uniref:NAD-dependent succinate-semialdehyde dehydrogenase n=1 Tax=unclassified Haloarcula TaxID=2624677 RepID=UPI000595572F|nr:MULTISPECIES: NAD-dependent succinate-semialdehyde dehydrogenase [unclassified Haloarcula]AJF24349.1 succinate-semialdehyde dehydrogenase [Haloarcula sp. CBA1115]KAA9400931.1 NAD-dependent succinate-semialdehyde dehydrogenase [Haloarcula sp. CBA1131]KZX49986.1 succinate-semialdehyde dehydrogenase [Haloarcula sp. K1]
MESVNPATGERLDVYDPDDDDTVERKLDRAAATFEEWRDVPLREREQLLVNAGEVLRENKQRYAELMTREMGKPITQAVAEVEKCAWACDHYAEYAHKYLSDEHHPSPPGTEVKTVHDPLGPVLAVMPWNYPFWQVVRFAAPYLTAGNVGLLKHASNVPGCALALEEVFSEAGYPEGAFQTLLVGSSDVDGVLADERVRAATLTGSGPAGRAVAETAGKHLKKTVLELGGSDPFIVLDDADLDAAVETGVQARTLNGGQSCIAAKRFIVHTDVYEEYVERLVAAFENLTVGDPMADETDVGPQADPDLMAELHDQVQTSVDAGATLLTGGEPLDRTGAFYPPTVLTDVPSGCPADTEETFGPVATVYEVADAEEAIAVANDTRFGLGASLWTADRERGQRLAREVSAGCVYINEMTKSDPRVPFGGIKDAGYGRELSEMGIKEFVNKKTVWVE